jgi:hypothetical protein
MRVVQSSATPAPREESDSGVAPNPSAAQMPRRRLINLGAATLAVVVSGAAAGAGAARADEFASPEQMALLKRQGKVAYTEAEWRSKLQGFSYNVLREEATERQGPGHARCSEPMGYFSVRIEADILTSVRTYAYRVPWYEVLGHTSAADESNTGGPSCADVVDQLLVR